MVVYSPSIHRPSLNWGQVHLLCPSPHHMAVLHLWQQGSGGCDQEFTTMGIAWPISKTAPAGKTMKHPRLNGIGRIKWYGLTYDWVGHCAPLATQICLHPFMVFESCMRSRYPNFFPRKRGQFQPLKTAVTCSLLTNLKKCLPHPPHKNNN